MVLEESDPDRPNHTHASDEGVDGDEDVAAEPAPVGERKAIFTEVQGGYAKKTLLID